MSEFSELFHTADWKSEKHVPVIDVPAKVKKGEFFEVTLTVGKEVSHPNTTEHHIGWIHVFFHPQDTKFVYDIGKTEFTSHGASADGPDSSGVYTHHRTSVSFKTDKPGTIHALSYCNIHGLWRNSEKIGVE